MARAKSKSGSKPTLTREQCLLMGQTCASANLRRAARNVTRHYEAALSKAGISATQLPILAAVNAWEHRTIAGLAADLDLERSTVSRDVQVLERNGLVRLEAGEDLRTREVRLTARGSNALVRGYQLWSDAHAKLKSMIGSEFDTMLSMVRKFARTTQAYSASPRVKG